MDLKQAEETKTKSSIEEPHELELKELPSHLEYAFLEESDKLPVIIAKDLKDAKKEALIPKTKRKQLPHALMELSLTVACPLACVILPVRSKGEGIVLGHKISKSRIEVDREKVDVIAKLSHPTTVKGVRSFLGQAGFYRRFIQDFSKIARPMTHLLEKEKPFVFSKDCVDAFNTLKKKLTESPILVVPDWNLPFELMCDARYENLAVDHLSRLENPHKDMLENKDINENFPLEILGSLSSNSTSWSIISDRGTHFCNDQFTRVMIKYGVTHRLAIAYHPQTSGQVEVSNCGLKRILESTVGENRASWSDKLDDALWAFRTTFKTPIGCTPYKLVYGKSFHLLIVLEHRAYWALKHVNFDLKTASDHRKLQLNELNELRDQAYENYVIYKERKLKTHWSGHFTITQVFPYGTAELSQPNGPNFKVNGHRVKHYFEGDIPSKDLPHND
nr:hypothetical protein [Tanacetum cinerariifolium]